MCVLPSSASSESVFSQAGLIVSKHRASVSTSHVSMLTFLSCNSEFLDSKMGLTPKPHYVHGRRHEIQHSAVVRKFLREYRDEEDVVVVN